MIKVNTSCGVMFFQNSAALIAEIKENIYLQMDWDSISHIDGVAGAIAVRKAQLKKEEDARKMRLEFDNLWGEAVQLTCTVNRNDVSDFCQAFDCKYGTLEERKQRAKTAKKKALGYLEDLESKIKELEELLGDHELFPSRIKSEFAFTKERLLGVVAKADDCLKIDAAEYEKERAAASAAHKAKMLAAEKAAAAKAAKDAAKAANLGFSSIEEKKVCESMICAANDFRARYGKSSIMIEDVIKAYRENNGERRSMMGYLANL